MELLKNQLPGHQGSQALTRCMVLWGGFEGLLWGLLRVGGGSAPPHTPGLRRGVALSKLTKAPQTHPTAPYTLWALVSPGVLADFWIVPLHLISFLLPYIYINIYIYIYSQEWEIDQLLQFCRCNFIFLIIAWFFNAKYSTKICPS